MTSLYKKPNRIKKVNPLKWIPVLIDTVKIVLKRQLHYVSLSILALINIILAVGLITNASFFSQAVDRVVLLEELFSFTSVTGRPPLSTSVYSFPSRRQPVTLETAENLALNISQTMSTEIGLPLRHVGTEISSGTFMLQPLPGSALLAETGNSNLGSVEAVYIASVAQQMEIIEGVSLDEDGASTGPMDVWMHDTAAQAMGMHIGDELALGVNLSGAKTPIRIAGTWKARDSEDDFWFNNPDSTYKDALLVRRNDYLAFIQPVVSSGSAKVSWYVILDEQRILPRNSAKYIDGFERSLQTINKWLPGARMNMPPLDPLEKFVDRSSALTVLLLGYNLPAFAILLYFLVLTSAIMAQWQHRETVVLVSRGMSLSGVLGLTTVEQLVLFAIGYPLGVMFGMATARFMGYTESFLTFTNRAPLPVSLEGLNLPLTVLAFSFALIARLLPAQRAARSSLVTDERERARPMHTPFWFRFYLDVLLLFPTAYAYDQMVKRGSLAGLVTDRPEDLFQDPLLVVVPALFILTASLVTMRLFALFTRLIDRIAGHIPWLALHLALRQLGRQSLDYVRPLLLVIIALAMGVYTLAMAASLDQWMVDRMYYRTGADLTFTPETGPQSSDSQGSQIGAVVDASWIPPTSEFAQLPGVAAAARVGEFDMAINPDTSTQKHGRFLGIDRAEFASAAWFRTDFASESLGAMMNRLAPIPEGVLVSDELMKQQRLQVGDILTLKVDIEGVMSTRSEYVIVGAYHYFPTVYEDKITIIGNLDYLAMLTGLTPTHGIWLRLDPGADEAALQEDLASVTKVNAGDMQSASALIQEERNRLERIGIFGTLSVGFLATALMAILGLLVYSYASLQERAYRLAVLNAVGLSRRQILTQIVIEYAFLAIFGALAGALIGVFSAELFIPFFRYTGETGIPLPPLLPVVSGAPMRNLSLAFGLTIVVVEILSMTSILRNRLTQIMKRVWM